MMMMLCLLSALIPTIVIEYGVLLLLGERQRRVLLSSVVMNCVTNVPLNVCLCLSGGVGWSPLLVAEGLVVVIEALWYFLLLRRVVQASVYSVLCNGISFLCGILFQLIYALWL